MCMSTHNSTYHNSLVLTIVASFNRREEDFVSLRAYNDYLEMKEDVTFNLIENIDVPATEAKIAAYAKQNTSSIARNAALASQEHSSLQKREAAQKELSRLDKQAAREAEEEERRERETARQEIVNRIAEGKGDPEAIAREGQKVVLKKSSARRTAAELARREQQMGELGRLQIAEAEENGVGNNGTSGGGFFIPGLKPAEVVEPEKEYDPFGGLNMERRYYQLGDAYEHEWLENARRDPLITAGGYDVMEYCARALLEAHAGLGCFIAIEKAEKGGVGGMGGSAGPAEVAVTGDVVMDDPL